LAKVVVLVDTQCIAISFDVWLGLSQCCCFTVSPTHYVMRNMTQ